MWTLQILAGDHRVQQDIRKYFETLWNLVEGHGSLWNIMEAYIIIKIIIMETHGIPWKFMEGHGTF